MRAGLIAIGLLVASAGAAQTEIPRASEIKAAGGTVPTLLSGPAADGKASFFARGIQGEIRVEGIVGTDGAFHDGRVTHSSRSEDLDAYALGLIAASHFKPAVDKDGLAVASRVAVPVYLWKDSLVDGSIFKKTCRDFVIDADWHAGAFPEAGQTEMRSWLLISGAIFAAQYSRGGQIKPGPDFQRVYDTCRQKPSRKFADVFVAG